MTASLSTVTDVLKTLFMPRLREQLNDKQSVIYKQLESTTENIQGENVVHGIHVRRSFGTGARAEGGTLPAAGRQGYDKLTSGVKSQYGRIKFTGQLMRRAVSDAGAFVNASQNEMTRIVEDIGHDQSRQLYNDSNAFLIRPSGAAAAQVVPVAGATAEQYRNLIIGMPVDIGTTGVAADQANSVTIASFSTSAETITFVGTVSSVSSAGYIRKEDNFGNEITGLRQIVAAGDSLFGVDGASEPAWNSYVRAVNGTPTENVFERAVDEIAITSGMVPNLVATTHGVQRNLAAQMKSQKRYNDTLELKGGYIAPTITTSEGMVALVADRFCPAGQAFFLSTDNLVYNVTGDWEWMSEDGAVLNRIPDQDGYEATIVRDIELTTDRRNAHGKLTGLTEL